ncbi:MAG: hypothetical protein IT518_13935, partial [Burkholderiales bacterium]|nr:hypothetical protein [Burkholderiales bacterium]
MNWIQIAWTMMAAASLTLGAIHLFVWFRQRSDYAHLLFFVLACSAAAYGAFEMAMIQALTPQRYADIVRWAHVPLAIFVISTVGFVHYFFDAGRAWLAYAVCGLRVLTLLLDFTTGENVNFTQVTAVGRIVLWGAEVSGPIGVASPWSVVPQLSNLLLVAYVVDAAVALWRRG